ncbi:MAG TPA: hypothetical protein G4O11_12220 [Anaerolineae bacterium]|nr:hypothetical protein [Anaerolineae bacterium]
MNARNSVQHTIVLTLVALLMVGCNGAVVEPTSIPTETSLPPTSGPTETLAPPTSVLTDTPVPPTNTPAPVIVPASQESITVDEFEFRVVRIALDEAIFGMVPNSMGEGDQILFIEFELTTGENEAFANLRPAIVLESGEKHQVAAWIGDKNVHTLTDMMYTGAASEFSPTEDLVALAYVIPQRPGALLLEFSSGVLIDLTPLMP